jgi:hypothetical protein
MGLFTQKRQSKQGVTIYGGLSECSACYILHCPTILEANVGGMAFKAETSYQ